MPTKDGVDGPHNSTPTIRKSCQFCRLRKIRCSGQRICDACRTRNLDCIYERESFKGRPKNNVSSRNWSQASLRPQSSSASSSGSKYGSRDMLREGARKHQKRRSTTAVPCETAMSQQFVESYANMEDDTDIGTILHHILQHKFLDNISPEKSNRNSLSSPSTDSSRTSANSYASDEGELLASGSSQATNASRNLFSTLAETIVELVCLRFGSLSCPEQGNRHSRFVIQRLHHDTRSNLIDCEQGSPEIPEYGDQFIRQLIELWLRHHPLAFIVSKTLLLHKHRNGDVDEVLLAVILAGAKMMLEETLTGSIEQQFLWVEAAVDQRRMSEMSLPVIQTLMLLGWHDIFFSNPRRGFCYLECARSAIVELRPSLSEASNMGKDFINGYDVGRVELELVQRIYWTTFAFEVWISLQLHVPSWNTSDPLGEPVEMPPIDFQSSTILALDMESGNVSTITEHTQMLRELWPLSHIASIINPIYALYPRSHTDLEDVPARWDYRTLSRLHRLLNAPSSIHDICNNVRSILVEGVHHLQTQPRSHPSRELLSFAYSIMIIHMHFPRSELDNSSALRNESTITDMLRSVSNLRNFLRKDGTSPPSDGGHPEGRNRDLIKASIQVMGLDACIKALRSIHEAIQSISGSEPNSTAMLHQIEILDLVNDLYLISKTPKLQAVLAARATKRALKNLKHQLESSPMLLPIHPIADWMDGGVLDMFSDSQSGLQALGNVFSFENETGGLRISTKEPAVFPQRSVGHLTTFGC